MIELKEANGMVYLSNKTEVQVKGIFDEKEGSFYCTVVWSPRAGVVREKSVKNKDLYKSVEDCPHVGIAPGGYVR